MSDAPVGPFVPRGLAMGVAATVVAAAACARGVFVVMGGRGVRVVEVRRGEGLVGGGVGEEGERGVGDGDGGIRDGVVLAGREVAGGKWVEAWFKVGEGVLVGRFGVDGGAWEMR